MKLLLIKNHKPSRWLSCQTISLNLQNLYIAFKKQKNIELIWFSITENSFTDKLLDSSLLMFDLKNLIKNEKPDKLIFIDHLPGPYQVLSSLGRLLEKNEIPPVVIHIYGDFTYYAKNWVSLNDIMMNCDLTLIVASEAQNKLVTCFLKQRSSQKMVQNLCFPVDSNQYYWDRSLRQKARSERRVEKDDFIFLYSGRISMQKNVDLLIKEFGEICISRPNFKCQLWIAGEFDDIGATFLGLQSVSGSMFNVIQDTIQALPSNIRHRVKLLGHLDASDLREILHAADLFVSLSLHHDEDFGMAPAEALSTGLCSALTSWGGYNSFNTSGKEWECGMIPVDITEDGLIIKISKLLEYVDYVVSNRLKLEQERAGRSIKFLSRFSIESNIESLNRILAESGQSSFTGFNYLLIHYGKKIESIKNECEIIEDMIPQNNNFYYEVYKNYL